jgi:hypothetical protein
MPHPPDKPRKPGQSDNVIRRSRPLPKADDSKNLAAQILGQLGGLKRASTMSPERRSEIARNAARRRWDKGSGS